MFDIVCEYGLLFRSVQKQLAFMLGRQQICFDLDPSMSNRDDLTEIMENVPLNNHFLSLAREVSCLNLCCMCVHVCGRLGGMCVCGGGGGSGICGDCVEYGGMVAWVCVIVGM